VSDKVLSRTTHPPQQKMKMEDNLKKIKKMEDDLNKNEYLKTTSKKGRQPQNKNKKWKMT
jgi:hypothetical protein